MRRMSLDSPMLGSLAVALIAIATGLGAVFYAGMVEGNPVLIAGLPLVLALLLLLVLDKRTLFLLILGFRASGDIVFETSKFAGGIGIGGLINILVIVIALLFLLERPAELSKRVLPVWAPLLLMALFAMSYAPDLKDALRAMIALVSYCAVFAIAFGMIRSRADFERSVTIILLSSLIPVGYAFVDIAQHFGAGEEFRLQSTFTHPNILAFYLVLNIALLFYRMKTLVTGARWPLALYMLLMFGLLLLTQTRSAWAACVAMFGLYALLFERKYLLYLLVMPALALLVPSVRDRLLDLGAGNDYVQYAKLNSFAWRQLLWKSAMEWMHWSHAALGYGLNAFKFYSPTFFPLAGKTHFGAHSTYVQWFFETGLAGILAAGWMYMRLFFTLWSGRRAYRLATFMAAAMLVGYLFFAFSDNMLDYLAFNWYYWFFLGTVCALIRLGDNLHAAPADSSDSSDKYLRHEQRY